MKEITLVKLDDWIGLYVNGRIKCQNHSLKPDDVLDALDIDYKVIRLQDIEGNLLPNELEDLK